MTTPNFNYTVPIDNEAYTGDHFPPTNFTILYPNPAVAAFYGFGGGGTHTYTRFNNISDSRRVGGGTRNEIYGNARYGSGHGSVGEMGNNTYGWIPSTDLQVANWLELPFGFWPIHWGSSGYGGSYQYYNDTNRPGGEQHLIIASTKRFTLNLDPNWMFYYIIGDNATIAGLNTILQLNTTDGGCGMVPSPIYLFEPDQLADNGTHTLRTAASPPLPRYNITLRPENVFQYYRDSSAAIATSSYQNQAAFSNNTNPVTMASTSFYDANKEYFDSAPDELKFVQCLNVTIASAIPILITVPPKAGSGPRGRLSSGVVAVIAVGLVLALLIASYLIYRRRVIRKQGWAGVGLGWANRPNAPSADGRRVVVADRNRNRNTPSAARNRGNVDTAEAAESLPLYSPARDTGNVGESPPPYTAQAQPSAAP
jgi:hypothetical protein